MSVAAETFLRDLIALLIERAKSAKSDAENGGEFARGRQIAYYEMLSLVEQQAKAFGLDLLKLGAPHFNADRDVL